MRITRYFFPSAVFALLLLFVFGCTQKEKTFKAVFTPKNQQVTWAINDINPDITSDWSDYKYLLVEMRSSSPQFFWFGFTTNNGYLSNRIQIFQNTWVKMSIPLDFYRTASTEGDEMASLWAKPRITGRMSTYGDNNGKLIGVDSVKIILSTKPFKGETFEIRSIQLSKSDTGERVISPRILMDEFGQWVHQDWPGKIHTQEELKPAWKQNDAITFSKTVERDIYGGFPDSKLKATGFFRLEKIDGKWWLIDPLGNLFLGTGVNGVRYVKYEYTPTHGRTEIFKALPPEKFHRPSSFGYAEPEVSYTQWNLFRRYGENWKKEWETHTVKRMRAWGLNMTNWSDTVLMNDIVYTGFLENWGVESGVMGIPDVYSHELANMIDSLASVQCSKMKNDPWMLGYFTGNEPVWPGRESLVVDAILKGPKTATRKKLEDFLKNNDTPEKRKQFIVDTYTIYLKMVKAAIKKYDPNHLILGTRLGGEPSDEAIKLAALFDVAALNIYAYAPNDDGIIDRVYNLSGRPVFIGEFHMGVPDRGMASGLVQVKDQGDKAKGYAYYVEHAFAHPAVIATTWYKWRDDYATGHEFGENYNLGIIDITDKAYPELIESIVRTHNRILKIHSGEIKPTNDKPTMFKNHDSIKNVF